ncbi:MAG: acylphosphatase [Oscillospiraceae bacterium]|nr:acylphosphatase [Oscillospiraceae bacterium]
MPIIKTLKKIRDNYVLNQVMKAKIPEFAENETVRFRYTFSGRVQKVGFRYALSEMAKRLGLTGWCRNCENGDVQAEIQGAQDKIDYLVYFMGTPWRIKITKKVAEKLELVPDEKGFDISK